MLSEPRELEVALPARVVVLPAEEVLFPSLVLPITVPKGEQKALLALTGPTGLVGVALRSDAVHAAATTTAPGEAEKPELQPGLFDVGCIGRILRNARLPGRRHGLMVAGVRRMHVTRYERVQGWLMADVTYPEERIRSPKRVEALMRNVRSAVAELTGLSRWTPEDIGRAAAELDEPGQLADFVAASLALPIEERQALLATLLVDERLRRILGLLARETDLARLGQKVQEEIQQNVEKSQRETYLREQLREIRRELGEEVDEKELELERFAKRLDELPEAVQERGRRELAKAQLLPADSSEYHMLRTYLDWLVELPWTARTEDCQDIRKAARQLERSHFGLKEVKQRIIEFLAVRKLNPRRGGAILCLLGPPGVGKTSLGQAIADALGRRFYRIALGGMRDEAEIRGHRITYVGAMPGRILQALRRVQVQNPVFMLDEVDKVGADWRSDPTHALLELLDPVQNHAFVDNYLDLPFDLSSVLFVATANVEEQIPEALRDRMEFIRLAGYVESEKQAIAARYLLPRQRQQNGLEARHLRLGRKMTRQVIEEYTQEAGVRELERQIGHLCRKLAAEIVLRRRNADDTLEIRKEHLERYLGPRRFARDPDFRGRRPGVALGLAWTPHGGCLLLVESVLVPGKGRLKLTGLVGKVMNESAAIALSHVRANAVQYGIDPRLLARHDVHIHIPEGAVAKDGPSAGITLATALISLLRRRGRGQQLRQNVAMTGELTLTGAVLPVGGIKEKVIAAQRAGLRTLILPADNSPDLLAIEPHLRRGLTVLCARTMTEVVEVALPKVTLETAAVPLRAVP